MFTTEKIEHALFNVRFGLSTAKELLPEAEGFSTFERLKIKNQIEVMQNDLMDLEVELGLYYDPRAEEGDNSSSNSGIMFINL